MARKKKTKASILIDGAKRASSLKDEASALGLSDEALERELGPGVEESKPEPVAEKPVAEKPVAEKPVAEKPVAEKPVAEKPVAKKPLRFFVVVGRSVSCRECVKVGEIKAFDVIGGEATLLELESRGLVVRE